MEAKLCQKKVVQVQAQKTEAREKQDVVVAKSSLQRDRFNVKVGEHYWTVEIEHSKGYIFYATVVDGSFGKQTLSNSDLKALLAVISRPDYRLEKEEG